MANDNQEQEFDDENGSKEHSKNGWFEINVEDDKNNKFNGRIKMDITGSKIKYVGCWKFGFWKFFLGCGGALLLTLAFFTAIIVIIAKLVSRLF
ncbi:MAG: hypothetical protein K9N49_05950 [Candidatus Marinimicrobia bacterium]|nr:hypothetical protein [Candidatus Neomarinimicrobiota bacterium]